MIRFAVVAVLLSGCASYVREYSIAMPAQNALQFFFHVTSAAKNRTYETERTERGVRIVTPTSDVLRYEMTSEEVVLIVEPNTRKKDRQEIEGRLEELHALGETLVDEARFTAERAKAFQ